MRFFRALIFFCLAAALIAAPAASATKKSRKRRARKPVAAQPLEAPSEQAQPRAQAAFRAMEALVAQQKDADSLAKAAMERKIEGYGSEFRSLGAAAVAPLCEYISDKSHVRKVRLYAAAFLGLIGDPGALAALKARLDDPKEGPGMRAEALQAAGSLRLSLPTRRALAEKAAFDPESPSPVVREALGQLAETGSEEVDKLTAAAKRYGSDPQGTKGVAARHAAAALMYSHKNAERALLSLLRYFKKGSALRADVLAALHGRKPKADSLPSDGIESIAACLFEEKGQAAFEAARLLGDIGDPRATGPLLRVLKLNDPAMLAEAAEALAKLGDASAAEPLAQLDKGLISDERFAPKGNMDPRPYAVRIQIAAEFFAQARRQALSAASVKPVKPGKPAKPEKKVAAAPLPRKPLPEVPDPIETPRFRAPLARLPAAPAVAEASPGKDISSDDEEPPPPAKKAPAQKAPRAPAHAAAAAAEPVAAPAPAPIVASVPAPAPVATPAPAPAPALEAPRGPAFRYEGVPSSEVPFPTWGGRRDSITLRLDPEDDAPTSDVSLSKGRPIPVIGSLVVTLEPGRMRAKMPVVYECRALGLEHPERPLSRADYQGPLARHQLHVKEGETLEILAYRPDGACFLRRRGRIYLGDCLTKEAGENFEIITEPKTRWWLQTKFSGVKGWFSADDDGINFEH